MRDCRTCAYARPYGGENDNRCAAWACNYVNFIEAIEAYYEKLDKESEQDDYANGK